MEVKQIYTVGKKEFSAKDTAEYYQKLYDAMTTYHNAAKEYENLLAECTCDEKDFISKLVCAKGEHYLDDFDWLQQKNITVLNYVCKCCGKDWSYGEFDGLEAHWRKGGNTLVKVGVF